MNEELKKALKQDAKAVAELLSTKSRWTTGAFARDAQRGHVGFSDNAAVCWCIEGAILREVGGDYDRMTNLAGALRTEIGVTGRLAQFNDRNRGAYPALMKALKKIAGETT